METSPDAVLRLLAEPTHLRAFAAVVLGATTAAEVSGTSGLSTRETAVALGRLRDRGIVVGGPDSLRVNQELLTELARVAPPPPEPDELDSDVRTFIHRGRIRRLPAAWQRKVTVLTHVADTAFAPGLTYTELAVNGILREWCEGGEVDHVSVRRYLVDMRLLDRDNATGTYRLRGR